MALAPGLSLKGFTNNLVLKFLDDEVIASLIKGTLRGLNIYEIYPANWLNTGMFKTLCVLLPDICKFGEAMFSDKNPDLNSVDASKVYLSHYPSGSSLKELEHFGQLGRAKKF